jgi:hypothetical protein
MADPLPVVIGDGSAVAVFRVQLIYQLVCGAHAHKHLRARSSSGIRLSLLVEADGVKRWFRESGHRVK